MITKLEVIPFGTAAQLRKFGFDFSYNVAGADMRPVYHVKVLGVKLDSTLHIRPYIKIATANALACITIGSRLDYCISLLAGVNVSQINRLYNVFRTIR